MAGSWRSRVVAGVAMGILLGSTLAPGAAVAAPPAGRAALPTAVTFTVNTTNDAIADFTNDTSYTLCQTGPSNGFCSLRAAVMNANRHPGGATINLPAGLYPLQILPVLPDDDSSGDLNITSTVNIVGAGAVNTIVDGGGTDDVFHVNLGAALTMTGVTIRHGATAFVGGGVASFGQLILADSVISGNTASNYGGGLFVNGTSALTNLTITGSSTGGTGGGVFVDGTSALTHVTIAGNTAATGGGLGAYGPTRLTNSTVNGNTSLGDAGGLYVPAPLTLTDSTVDDNQAGGAGGGLFSVGSLTVFNSTINNNRAAFDAGGLLNDGSARFFHTTLAGNLADSAAIGGYVGGGIFNAAVVQLWNTLLADNYVSNTLSDCTGNPLTSEDYNYLETTDGCTVNGLTTHNVTGGDPLLASLADNGGATQTRALLAGSPARDAGDAAVCAAPPVNNVDQRGVVRPIRGLPGSGPALCDIGAYEAGAPVWQLFLPLIRR